MFFILYLRRRFCSISCAMRLDIIVIRAPLTPPKYSPKFLQDIPLKSFARYIVTSRALFFLRPFVIICSALQVKSSQTALTIHRRTRQYHILPHMRRPLQERQACGTTAFKIKGPAAQCSEASAKAA